MSVNFQYNVNKCMNQNQYVPIEEWMRHDSKCFWIKKQLELFRIYPWVNEIPYIKYTWKVRVFYTIIATFSLYTHIDGLKR